MDKGFVFAHLCLFICLQDILKTDQRLCWIWWWVGDRSHSFISFPVNQQQIVAHSFSNFQYCQYDWHHSIGIKLKNTWVCRAQNVSPLHASEFRVRSSSGSVTLKYKARRNIYSQSGIERWHCHRYWAEKCKPLKLKSHSQQEIPNQFIQIFHCGKSYFVDFS